MKWKCSHCFTTAELFDNFDVSILSGKQKRKKDLCASVLMYCLYLIMLDIIENNVTFVLPLFGGREACFYVKMFEGDTFQNMYSKGKFKGIDFMKSDFKGYQIFFQYTSKGDVREKPVYISCSLKDKFYENINNGKKYY